MVIGSRATPSARLDETVDWCDQGRNTNLFFLVEHMRSDSCSRFVFHVPLQGGKRKARIVTEIELKTAARGRRGRKQEQQQKYVESTAYVKYNVPLR